jgi:hypothetical protein
MRMIPSLVLVFGAAFAWLGVTVFVILRLRRRRNGSTLVASASAPTERAGGHSPHRPWRRVRPVTGQTPARRRLRLRKIRS